MNINYLQNKTIFIYPYNDLGLKFKSFLFKSNIEYNFLGFIDTNKSTNIGLGYKVHKPEILKCTTFDLIIITSPAYFEEINFNLNDLCISKSKIVNGLNILNKESATDSLIDFNKIKKFNNIHKNDRCFIIGTGPSLKTDDLEQLVNEITFGANG